MSSNPIGPAELHQLLEEYSLKLEDFKSKFNPFFSQISLELQEKVDSLRYRIELYAHYHLEDQLKHLTDSKKAQKEIKAVSRELEELHLKMNELERIYKLGNQFS